jgi:hypothetical protein
MNLTMRESDFDSKEELYFYWWALELIEAKLILNLQYHPKPFLLFDGLKILRHEQLKTKIKNKEKIILSNHEYQADFLIYWNKKGHRIFYADSITDSPGTNVIHKVPFITNYNITKNISFSVIDVKGTFNQNDAYRRFSIDQKWIYQKFNIYVQKIITHPSISKLGKMTPADALFYTTFLPKRFTYTDTGMPGRKINYPFLTLNQYLLKHQ